MEPRTQDECDRIEPEVQRLAGAGAEAADFDDDEVEELHKSLKEIVQDPTVKPKLQCLMVDPSFSMVTVQSEDSGIVWETASSRCSTPWASEASSPSDAFSLEGSGTQGNVIIIMDEEKIKRRKTKGMLGDRFRRPGSRLLSPAIGEERPAMVEVSVPNVRNETPEGDQTGNGNLDKDQELFNLISEGFEILNIVVPSKLPTVDEEESTELADNLSYLQDTPKIKSKCKHHEDTIASSEGVDIDIQETKDESEKDSCQTSEEQPKKDETDMDYLEKFTLLDQHAPGDESKKVEPLQVVQPEALPVPQEEAKVDDTLDEDSFVIISDVEIASEHLDEVFYGASCDAEPVLPSPPREEKRAARESAKTRKECGSTLFDTQETILTPIFLSPGPPKIIDQDLLDEPRAMSFHYSDLYEDAIGDRKKDDDFSDAESVVSEKSFKRRFSDSDDGDGYLEKFILKDDTPDVEDTPGEDHAEANRIIWPQSKFEMTGCLVRVQEEIEPQEEDVSVSKSEGDVSKSESEGKDDVSKGQIQTMASSEDCGEKGTGCVTVKSVSEAVEDCEDCGTKTGCVITKMKSLLEDDDKHEEVQLNLKSNQVCVGEVSELKLGTKTEHGIKGPSIPQKQDKAGVGTGVSSGLGFQDDLKRVHKVTDKSVEIQATIITKEKVLSKGQQQKNKAQEKSKLELVKEVDVKDTSVLAAKVEKIVPHKEIRKELPVGKKEFTSEAHIPEKTVKEVKCSAEKAAVPEPDCQVEDTSALLDRRTKPVESMEIPAPVEKGVNISEDLPKLSKTEWQEQTTDKPSVQQVKSRISTEQKATEVKTEPKTISEQKTLEELLASETEKSEERHEEVNTEITEKILQENQSMKETVEAMDTSVPVAESETAEMSKSVDSVTAVDSLNIAVPSDLTSAKHVLVEDAEKVEDKVLKDEKPSDLLLPQSLSSVPKNTETDLVPVVASPTLLDVEVGRTEKDEMAETKQSETVSPISAAKTEDPSVVSMPPPVATEVVTKEKVSEIREVEIDRIKTESSKIPEIVYPVYAAELDDGSKTSEQEVEGKSTPKKVFLKDTHTENIWKTVEPTTPPPPVEVQDSTMRVSPLELAEHKENDEFLDRKAGLFSTLRSFSPHEDLSGFGCDGTELDVHKEIVDELDYEIVTKQDARQSETEVIVGKEECQELKSQDQYAEEPIEADYEFIEDLDGDQTSEFGQMLEKIEIQPMDAFCIVCRCPILISDGGHQDHEVSTLDKAFEDIKDQLSNWISVLQERSENIEDMVSELELAYNTVEEHCKDSEKAIDEQNEEMMKLVMDQYNEMSQTMEEEKKTKLEQLYDQIVSFQENIDSAKDTMEKTTKEMEELDHTASASSFKDIDNRLKTALESTMSLELGPRGLLVFEDYAKGTSGNEKKKRQAIPVPQPPHLQPQEPNSATGTSVTVYWTVNEGDIIDCFQVYCMEEPQGAISEEYRVTVKESYCSLEELEPDKCYKVWVMAVNYTGCSLPSERLPFRTAPSVPVIHSESCTVLWDSAVLRWSTAQPSAVESYTLEYCRQYALEGEGLRSVSGIKGCKHKVLVQPNENFLFYIKSVNYAGASEQSEAALISTRGTRFHLLSKTANSVLKVSEDKYSVEYPLETYNEMSSLIECPAVMGELLPRVGFYYWETEVSGCKAYRIGVAYQSAPQDSVVGEDGASWCLHCVPTSISCRFELLHDKVESDVFVMDVPVRIGTLLDFRQGRLVFFNAQNGQCLGSFQHAFSQACHPIFVLERPGKLELKMTMEVPEFAKNW